jgi:3-oxoacyl-[acyl-carrier-protein] synthase II
MRKRVVVTGLGCISPVGNNVEDTWKNILAGKSGATKITHFDASGYKSRIAAEVKNFDPKELFGKKDARRMDRSTQFAIASALEALEDSGLEITEDNRDKIGAVIGSGIGGIGSVEEATNKLDENPNSRISPFFIPMILPDIPGGMLAIQLGIRGNNLSVMTACASGTNAIGEAANMIARGQLDVVFAGGTEAIITPLMMAGMASMTALTKNNENPTEASRPFDKNRDGFLMGEGAAMLILESLDHALFRDANILGEITGYGSTNDGYHISAPDCDGNGAIRSMNMALEDAKLSPDKIDYINAHGTSTYLNDKTETLAVKSVFQDHANSVPISSTKSMTGHMIGATGAMEAVFCIKSIQSNEIPPTINYETPDPECDLDYVPNNSRKAMVKNTMSNSFGFGGHNATLIISEYVGYLDL